MNKDVIKEIIKLKIRILAEITDCLPETLKERIDKFQYKTISMLSEAADCFLAVKKPDNENKKVQKVTIE
jgi:hypothetical protein